MLQRLVRLFSHSIAAPEIADLYRAIMAQSRLPVFYQELGVPDTVDGRFDLLVLHVILVLRRMENAGAEKQELFDLMFADMDRNLREMGVGDMSVGKRMKPMLAAFYGRAKAYESALAAGSIALTDVLQRNLYRNVNVSADVQAKMVDYVQRCVVVLDGQTSDGLLSGHAEFATPLV